MSNPDALTQALGNVDLGLSIWEARPLSPARQATVDTWAKTLSHEEQSLLASAGRKHPSARTEAEKIIWARRGEKAGGEWRKHPEREAEREQKWRTNPKNKLRQQLMNRMYWFIHAEERQQRQQSSGNQFRSLVKSAMTRNGLVKSKTIENLIGCSWDELMGHIELQFQEDKNYGMSWNNTALWHLDHIKPIVSFDLQDPQQQKKCFNYTNLRPMWGSENLSKGAKLNFKSASKPREATDEIYSGELEQHDKQKRNSMFPANDLFSVPEHATQKMALAFLLT